MLALRNGDTIENKVSYNASVTVIFMPKAKKIKYMSSIFCYVCLLPRVREIDAKNGQREWEC